MASRNTRQDGGDSRYSAEGRTYSRSSSRRSSTRGSSSRTRGSGTRGRRADEGSGARASRQDYDSASSRYSRNSSAYGSGAHGAYEAQGTQGRSVQFVQGAAYEQRFAHASGQAAQYSRVNTDSYSHARVKKSGRGKRVLIAVVASLVVVLMGAGVAAALFVNSLNETLAGGKSAEENLAIKEKLVQTANFEEPFYMLLIGSDAREDDDSMGQRSDTTILVRIDPKKHVVTMLSIPRDTKINYKGSTVKFNAAYAYDGAAGAIEATSNLCHVDIAHYAEVDFTALTSIVDALGGVDVYLESRIDNWKAGDEVIEAGQQHLNGAQALVYARDRDYVDGDFTRTLHQRNLVNAMIDKVRTLSIGELPGVLQAACKSVSTDLNVNDIYALGVKFIGMDDLQIYSIMIPSTTATIDGASYVIANEEALRRVLDAMEQGIDPNTVITDEDGSVTGGEESVETIPEDQYYAMYGYY